MDFVGSPAAAPAAAGAYLLLVALAAPLRVALPRRPDATLLPGLFAYAGSARGPGGLRARLAHHFRADKKPHWHIDRLTTAGTVHGAWCLPGGDECAIIAGLPHLPVPLPGFGSTDCRRCASHLLAWPPGTGAPDARLTVFGRGGAAGADGAGLAVTRVGGATAAAPAPAGAVPGRPVRAAPA